MCTVENTRGFNVCYGGETSLTRAISLEQFEITFYLLNKEGIDVDSMNRWDRTALMLASCTSNVSLIDSLISAGADVQKSDLYGDTALHLSAFYDRIDVLNRLLLMGTDVDKTNHKGRTPFFVAVDNLALVSARALVKSGCDVNKSNHDQRTPLMVLAGHNMKMSFEKGIKESDIISIIEYMKSHDVDMSATDKNGDTALHFAVESRNVYLVACLLQYGCSANIRNHEGLTAFTKAILYGQYKSADIMTMFCDMNSLLSNDSLGLFRRLLLDNTERPLSEDQRVLCLKILDIVDYAMLENFRVIISERKPLNTEENEFLQTLLPVSILTKPCQRKNFIGDETHINT
ncbi:hypothetical protein FSP39_022145 [Pinctada imbricata]|uniref:Uncharacterized protein n=1 Tax=Pinctada imbricata TaxID=66713 RepID=A0AA89CBH5_PINIB|nr:hypothetical protein FSP39_022145 [Pinctada imbricata]